MEYKTHVKHVTCHGNNDGIIKLNIYKHIGKLYINWLNLPSECKINNHGKTITNVPAGTYLVELEDKKNFADNKHKISIHVQQPDPLKIDFVKLQQPTCYDDTGQIDILISGGSSPYFVLFDKYSIRSESNKVRINNISNNTKSKIIIRDANNCIFKSSEYIIIHKAKPSIDINIISPTAYGLKNSKVDIMINNMDNYKIGWYKLPDIDKPIATNTLQIHNQLIAGQYQIKCIDTNNCVYVKDFSISQPAPTSIKFHTTPDYTIDTKYSAKNIKLKYNSLLIPYNNDYQNLLNIIPGDTIRLKNNKGKINKHKIILQPDIIDIDGMKYYRVFIFPLIEPNLIEKTTTIILNDEQHKIHFGFKNKYQCYICLSSLILDTSFNYAFNSNDKCDIYIGDTLLDCVISHMEQQYNIYEYSINNTILYPSLSSDLLKLLNHNLGLQSIQIKSRDTTAINKKGSIYLSINAPNDILEGVYTIDAKTYKYKIICYNSTTDYYNIFYTNDNITISDLPVGDYKIEIDKYMINFLNGYVLNDQKFDFTISNHDPNKPKIGNITPLAKFKRPNSNTGIFVNIPPYDQSFTLVHKDQSIDYNSSYQVLNNLEPGQYTVIMKNISKNIFVAKNQFVQINSLR